ncbi:MAG: tetratricopeptide repeat protein [bacterium]|nr:tetratricopeptide repeat protein [bacterium]
MLLYLFGDGVGGSEKDKFINSPYIVGNYECVIMNRNHLLLLLVFISFTSFSQTVDEYIKTGIEYHDAQKYEDAIAAYEKALEIDSKNQLANYEMALTYFTMSDYDNAIKYADAAIKTDGDNTVPAYILKGSALDNDGRTDESIKTFKKAIKKTGGHYLLHYNLGLNYYKIGEREMCEEQMVAAIDDNPSHNTSHLLLGLIHDEMGHKVQTVLALCFFLYLEDDTERSKMANETLMAAIGANVEQDPDKPNTINIGLTGDADSEFMAAELMISMMEAQRLSEENEDKTEEMIFQENLTSFFGVMGELKEEGAEGIWWNLYTDTFYALSQSEHMEAYCNVIRQSNDEEAGQWLKENVEAEKALDEWFQSQPIE